MKYILLMFLVTSCYNPFSRTVTSKYVDGECIYESLNTFRNTPIASHLVIERKGKFYRLFIYENAKVILSYELVDEIPQYVPSSSKCNIKLDAYRVNFPNPLDAFSKEDEKLALAAIDKANKGL